MKRQQIFLLGLISYFISVHSEEEAIQSVEVGIDGGVKAAEPVKPQKHPNALEVIFENQSGEPVELYWDDSKNGILQAAIEHTHQTTINTFLGHRFYYTPKGRNGSKDTSLYTVTMAEHHGLITLYDPKTMSERGAEFERKKSAWMKEYFQKTGRRWQNFYPREEVTHHYHEAQQGEIIQVTTDRTKFHICKEGEATAENIAFLDEAENAWTSDPKNTPPPLPEKCATKEIFDDECIKKPPASFQTENDNFYVGRQNGTTYCRPKIVDDKNVTYEIINICAHGPRAFRIYNFLSDDEMEHIKILGQYLGLKRSTVSEEATVTLDRTSQTCWIERDKSFVVDNVIRRIADVMQIPREILFLNASSESLQLVHYFGGELYKSHVDYGTDKPHNRYITFLMYLNEVGAGGNTSFPRADEKCLDENKYFGVQPIKGSIMFFYNLFPDGNVDPKTQHYAEPPVDSEKWMTNLWIWDRVFTR